MRYLFPITIVAILVALPAFTASAQRGKARYYQRVYDTSTVETVSGTVTDVIYRPGKRSGMQGVELSVQTGEGTVSIHLGPRWYLDQQGSFKKGDRLSISGSRVIYEGASVIIAARVERGDMVLVLRDRQGFPAWRGWRMRQQGN